MHSSRERTLRGRRTRPLFRKIWALCLAGTLSAPALGANYFEFVSGDLSDDPAQPTVIAVDAGDNRIGGQTIDFPTDADIFTLVVPPGLEITTVSLTEFRLLSSPSDGGSLVALEAGGQITDLNSSENLRGFVIAGVASGTQVGDDLLDDLGGGTLGAGEWTFWVQNTGSVTEYELNAFAEAATLPPVDPGPRVTVPVPGLGPAGLAVLMLSFLLLGLFRSGKD